MNSLGGDHKAPWNRIFLVWLALALMLVLVNLKNLTAGRFPDPDDTLRLVQVRDLLAGQGWFDLHQYRINPGASPVMHWSRIVDAPLALLASLLTPIFGPALAEKITLFAVPLTTLLAVLLVVGRMAARLFNPQVAIFACLSVGLFPVLIFQLQPLRIDHHGWQVFSVLLALAAIFYAKSWRGGALAGLALSFGLMISLEVLPVSAGFGLVLLLRWLRDPQQRWGLASFLLGLSAGLFALYAATRGFADSTEYCDVIAPADLGLFAIIGLGVAGVAAARVANPYAVLALVGLTGLAGLGYYLWLAPECSNGPFANLDPLVQKFWYEKVLEGRPAWLQLPDRAIPIVAQGFVALGTVYLLWKNAAQDRKSLWMEWGIVLAVALLTGLLVWRSMAFVGVLSAVPYGWLMAQLLEKLRATDKPLPKLGVGLMAILLLLPAAPFALARTFMVKQEASVDSNEFSAVRESRCDLPIYAPQMNRFAPTTLFAPIDISPALLERTHHSVVATGHHRGKDGMLDVVKAYTSTPEDAEPIIRAHKAGYLLVCTDILEPRFYAVEAPDGLAAQLLNGNTPGWLEEVTLDEGTPDVLRVWKVED